MASEWHKQVAEALLRAGYRFTDEIAVNTIVEYMNENHDEEFSDREIRIMYEIMMVGVGG